MRIGLTICSCLLCISISVGQTIEKFSIDSGGASTTANGIEMLYTIGEVHLEEANVNPIVLSEGFINPEVSATLSVGEEDGFSIKIFPNPVSQTLYIFTKQTLEIITLYDVLGKEVYASKHSNQIDVSRYQQGLYFLKVKTNMGSITKKIIIN